jgi:hypothetical protein
MKPPLLSDRECTLKESDLERQIAEYLALDGWYRGRTERMKQCFFARPARVS